MHRLDRTIAPVPSCLASYRQGVDTWDDVSPTDKAQIRACLEVMQGRRCAYCEASIDDLGYHIEHFRRKRDFPQLTFTWSNLLMCCGKDDCCGHHKDRAGSPYDIADLVDPTNEEPDEYFWFLETGMIDVRGGCQATQARRARETLRVLNLNQHGRLRPMRARQLKWYKDSKVGFIEELLELPDADRRPFIQEELAETASEPFFTIIRHFLQDLAR